IFVRQDDPKFRLLENARRQISQSGMIILDQSDSQFEFVGTVTHYNPERVGWLSVEDRSSATNTIMFFPADVNRSAITEFKVGIKVKFRPRIEGFATIATDLTIATDMKIASA